MAPTTDPLAQTITTALTQAFNDACKTALDAMLDPAGASGRAGELTDLRPLAAHLTGTTVLWLQMVMMAGYALVLVLVTLSAGTGKADASGDHLTEPAPREPSRWNAAAYRHEVTLASWRRHRDDLTCGRPRYPLLHDLDDPTVDPTVAAAVIALATADHVLTSNPHQAHAEADRRSPAWRAVLDAEAKIDAAITKARRAVPTPADQTTTATARHNTQP